MDTRFAVRKNLKATKNYFIQAHSDIVVLNYNINVVFVYNLVNFSCIFDCALQFVGENNDVRGKKDLVFRRGVFSPNKRHAPPPPPSNLRDSPFISMYICARVYHPQLKYKHVNIYPLPVPVISMLSDSYSQQGVNLLTTFTPANVSVTGALIVLITGLKEKPSCICGILELIHP